MEHEQTSNGRAVRTPPYVSFRTFLTVLEDFKTIGLPPRIDRSVLTRFSGGVGSQLIMALKSLGLTDDEGVPTSRLPPLVAAHGTLEFPEQLRSVLNDAYPYLADLDLTTATPSMFADTFKNAIGAKEDVLRKCRTFYLHAAKEAGIEMGARLEKGSHPRTASSGNGRRRRKTTKTEETAEAPTFRPPQPQTQAKELEYQLIDLMTESDIDDDVKSSIWQLIQYLTARKARKAAANDATASK